MEQLNYIFKWSFILIAAFFVIVFIAAGITAGSERLEKRKSIEQIEQSIDTTTQQKVVY